MLLLAYGHDEEVGGRAGAQEVAKLLQKQGVQLDFILDEGGPLILDGLPPFLSTPLALVGTAEKVGSGTLVLPYQGACL